MEERNLEKFQQGAEACTSANPGQQLESQRREGELRTQKSSPLVSNFSIQMALSVLEAGTPTFQWAFESVCEYLEHKCPWT